MLLYQLRMAALSLRRNLVLTLVVVAGVALGVSVATAFVTIDRLISSDPIPHKSDRLRFVRLDSWDPADPFDSDRPDLPPNQLTYQDALAIHGSGIPTYEAAMYKSRLTVHPDNGERPWREVVRLTHGDLFDLFDVPFAFGSRWDAAADGGPEPVVVIDTLINEKLFGGGDSVGREIRIEDRTFVVVGVLDEWRPPIKMYDVNNNPYEEPESIYIPFGFAQPLEATSNGNTNGWRFQDLDGWEEYLAASEDTFIQYWVQLDTQEQVGRFQSYVDGYAEQQKMAGRFPRPLNNLLQPLPDLLLTEEVRPEETRGLAIISILFLVVCSVNLIGVLLGKFLSRAPEAGIRRALGASRRTIFLQHLLECELVAVAGGLLGAGLAVPILRWVEKLFAQGEPLALDTGMLFAGIALALVSGLVAGLYPSWRVCRVAPATYLKLQ